MAKRRLRRLTDLEIDEVSWVDHPANQKTFLFFKNDAEIDKKAFDLGVTFKTGGSPGDTSIKVNGKTLEGVEAFSLFYMPIGEDAISLSAQYTVANKGETNGGFKASRTFRLNKNDPNSDPNIKVQETTKADDDDIEILKSFVGELDDDIDGELAKALAEQVGTVALYLDDCPRDMADAVRAIVKLATQLEVEAVAKEDTPVATETKPEEKTVETAQPAAAPIDMDKLVSQVTESLEVKIGEVVRDALKEQSEAAATAEAEAAEKENAEEELTEDDLAEIAADAVNEALSENDD